jgi:hypothetical protein
LWGGVYGISEEGRSRFGIYPDLIADDLFADQGFEPSEIEVVDVAPAVITVPRRTRDLIHVSRRRRKGNSEIRSLPDGPPSTASSTVHNLLSTARSGPGAAMDTLVFFAFAIILRISVAVSPPAGWSRDQSSRTEIMSSVPYQKDPAWLLQPLIISIFFPLQVIEVTGGT